jgi:hypothetical protein
MTYVKKKADKKNRLDIDLVYLFLSVIKCDCIREKIKAKKENKFQPYI